MEKPTHEPWRQAALRGLPAIHEVLATAECQALIARHGQPLVAAAAAQAADAARAQVLAAADAASLPPAAVPEAPAPARLAALAAATAQAVRRLTEPSLRPVLNATGVVLHTNLGRAVLAPAAVAAVTAIASGYSNLELDLASGERGSRYVHVEALLCHLTGAEAALVVNNNAAALLLALSALAHGREAIVSRGELVEIGGSFRVPDVMRQSGVTLREVGTTNRTHPGDYAAAIGPETALLLKVHTSNYRVEGFTASVPAAELARLGAAHEVPVLYDLGAGTLAPVPGEPTLGEALAGGVGLVTASGDKLLGGPQAGVLIGRRELVERCRRHPLTRAVRIDKLTLAALEATLRLYLAGGAGVPALDMLALPAATLRRRAGALARRLRRAVPGATVTVRPAEGQAGGGSLPGEGLPGYVAALSAADLSLPQLAAALRLGEPAVVARQQQGELWFDPRTLLPGQDRALAAAVAAAAARLRQPGPAGGPTPERR